jgi:competence protein ComEC
MGHTNAILVQTPGGAQILVDGGHFPSRLLTAIGDRVPFTDREIELLIITHPDEFDISALTAVLERYDVGAVITNGQPNQGAVYTRLREALARTPVVTAVAGYRIEVDDGVWLEVLHPVETPTLSDDIGDNALVVRLSYGDVSFLLTSDIGVPGQRALIDNGAWPLATVMQLPQHATARSLDQAFLAAVQAQALVVQVDPANRRGDPDPDVLALLEQTTPLFRTDQGGVVHFWTDGRTLQAEQAMD